MIGNPFPFSVSVSDLQVRYEGEKLPLLEAQGQGWASAYLFGYDLEAGGWIGRGLPQGLAQLLAAGACGV